MQPDLAEDFDKKIGGAVDDFGMLSESRRCVDKPRHLHHALYPVEVAIQRYCRSRNDIEAGAPRGTLRVLEVDIIAHNTHIFEALGAHRDLARYEQKRAGSHPRNIGALRNRWCWQLYSEIFQSCRYASVHTCTSRNKLT